MTQTFFNHFNCRRLSPLKSVVQTDYSVYCVANFWTLAGGSTLWWILAAVSALGLAFISFGVPIFMFLRMRRSMAKYMRDVKHGKTKRIIAYRDFNSKYGFAAGDYKPEAYYAEPVDLIRKLILSGFMGLIYPGSVLQSFLSVIFSIVFLLLHIKMWPYQFLAPNVLKLISDFQIVLCTLVSLVLKIDAETLAEDNVDREFYGFVLYGLLLLTILVMLYTVMHESKSEKALYVLQRAANLASNWAGKEGIENADFDPKNLKIRRSKTEKLVRKLPGGKFLWHMFGKHDVARQDLMDAPRISEQEKRNMSTPRPTGDDSVLQNDKHTSSGGSDSGGISMTTPATAGREAPPELLTAPSRSTTPPRLNMAQVIAAKQLAQKAVRKRQLPPLPAAQPSADVDNGPLPRSTTPPRFKLPTLPTQPAAAAGEAMQAPPNEPETSEQSVPPKGAPPTLAAMSAARSSGATPPRKTRGRAPILPSQRGK